MRPAPFPLVLLALPVLACAPARHDPAPPASEGEGEGDVVGEGEGDVVGEGEGDVVGEGEGDVVGEGEGDVGGACEIGVVDGCEDRGGGEFACALEHDGLARTFRLHVPPSLAASATLVNGRAPIVFSFHGLDTTSSIQEYLSQMNDDADAAGYVVIYPEGTGASTSESFNAGTCCGSATASGVDDVGFTRAILAHVHEALCVDDNRVFATGLSNGGHMSYRLACEASDVFAAIAPVAGLEVTTSCNPARKVSVLHFHGTSDPIVSYTVGIDGAHGAVDSVERWAGRDGCAATPTTTFTQGEVSCANYLGCADGTDVELCTVDGGGHQWPGGNSIPLLGHNTTDVSATQMISAFFLSHGR